MRRPEEIEVGRQERNWGDVLRTRTGDDCVSAEDLIAFVEARLDPASRMTVIQHLGHCAGCRDTVFLMRAADRAAQPRARGIQRFAVGLGFGFGLAVVAGALVIATNLWSPTKVNGGQGTPVAMNDPKITLQPSVVETKKPVPPVTTGNPVKPTNSNPKPPAPTAVGSTPKTSPSGTGSGSPPKVTDSKPAPVSGQKKIPEPSKVNSNPPGLFNTETKRDLVAMNTGSDTSQRALKFYLVGQEHVYSMDSKDAHLSERQGIELDYAENVANIQADYKKALESGADPAGAAEDLTSSLQKAASERDGKLGELYTPADDQRDAHPELVVQGDAPYQVVEVKYHGSAVAPVFDSYQVHAPWPGYVVEDRPYGWRYGVVYTPDTFRTTYRTWHREFVASGRTFSGLRGHSGHVEADLVVQGPGRYGLHSMAGRNIVRSGAASPGRYGSSSTTAASHYGRSATRTSGTSSGYGRASGTSSSISGSKYTKSARVGSSGYGSAKSSTTAGSSRYSSKLGTGNSTYGRGNSTVRTSASNRYGASTSSASDRYSHGKTSTSGTTRLSGGTRGYSGAARTPDRSSGYGVGSTRPSGGSMRSNPSSSRPSGGSFSGGRTGGSFGGSRPATRGTSNGSARPSGGSTRSGHH